MHAAEDIEPQFRPPFDLEVLNADLVRAACQRCVIDLGAVKVPVVYDQFPVDPDADSIVADRPKRVVAGRKVQPAEVEEILRRMPGVRDVRVVAAADPQRGEHVAACIAVDREHRDGITTVSVRQYCSARLAAYKIPRTVVLLESIPLTARGKTDRRALDEAIQAQLSGNTEQLC